MHVGWPQGICIGLTLFNLTCAAIQDGEPKKGNHSLSISLLGTLISYGLLYWGGFFK